MNMSFLFVLWSFLIGAIPFSSAHTRSMHKLGRMVEALQERNEDLENRLEQKSSASTPSKSVASSSPVRSVEHADDFTFPSQDDFSGKDKDVFTVLEKNRDGLRTAHGYVDAVVAVRKLVKDDWGKDERELFKNNEKLRDALIIVTWPADNLMTILESLDKSTYEAALKKGDDLYEELEDQKKALGMKDVASYSSYWKAVSDIRAAFKDARPKKGDKAEQLFSFLQENETVFERDADAVSQFFITLFPLINGSLFNDDNRELVGKHEDINTLFFTLLKHDLPDGMSEDGAQAAYNVFDEVHDNPKDFNIKGDSALRATIKSQKKRAKALVKAAKKNKDSGKSDSRPPRDEHESDSDDDVDSHEMSQSEKIIAGLSKSQKSVYTTLLECARALYKDPHADRIEVNADLLRNARTATKKIKEVTDELTGMRTSLKTIMSSHEVRDLLVVVITLPQSLISLFSEQHRLEKDQKKCIDALSDLLTAAIKQREKLSFNKELVETLAQTKDELILLINPVTPREQRAFDLIMEALRGITDPETISQSARSAKKHLDSGKERKVIGNNPPLRNKFWAFWVNLAHGRGVPEGLSPEAEKDYTALIKTLQKNPKQLGVKGADDEKEIHSALSTLMDDIQHDEAPASKQDLSDESEHVLSVVREFGPQLKSPSTIGRASQELYTVVKKNEKNFKQNSVLLIALVEEVIVAYEQRGRLNMPEGLSRNDRRSATKLYKQIMKNPKDLGWKGGIRVRGSLYSKSRIKQLIKSALKDLKTDEPETTQKKRSSRRRNKRSRGRSSNGPQRSAGSRRSRRKKQSRAPQSADALIRRAQSLESELARARSPLEKHTLYTQLFKTFAQIRKATDDPGILSVIDTKQAWLARELREAKKDAAFMAELKRSRQERKANRRSRTRSQQNRRRSSSRGSRRNRRSRRARRQ